MCCTKGLSENKIAFLGGKYDIRQGATRAHSLISVTEESTKHNVIVTPQKVKLFSDRPLPSAMFTELC